MRIFLRALLLAGLVLALAAGCGDDSASGGQGADASSATAGQTGVEGGALGGSAAGEAGRGEGGTGASDAVRDGTELRATVSDVFGHPLEGVEVSVVDSKGSATSDASGAVSLNVENDRMITVKFSGEGYTEQFKVVALGANTRHVNVRAQLLKREVARTIPSVEVGGAAAGRHGVRLELPPNALVDERGKPVTGAIDVTMTPVDVLTAELEAFPGRFEGVDEGGAQTPLVSYGVVEFKLTQDDRPLQLAPDAQAAIELPIYATQHPDGSDIVEGDTIPLWSLDEATGLWQQEGTGTVVASVRAPSGFALRATVRHFSWWNCDMWPRLAQIRVRCTIDDGDADSVRVEAGTQCQIVARLLVENRPQSRTDFADAPVPIGQTSGELGVPAERELTLEGCAVVERIDDGELVEACGSASINLAEDETRLVSLSLSVGGPLTVELLAPTSDLTTDAEVEIEVSADGEPTSVDLLAVDQFDPEGVPFVIKTWSEPPYTLTWDTRNVKQGVYLLGVQARRSGLVAFAEQLVEVTVQRDSPPPEARFSAVSATGRPLYTFAFDPSATTTQGPRIESYLWDFGDGDQALTAEPAVVRHRFRAPGTYAVALRVTDIDGGQSTAVDQVTIAARDSLGPIQLEQLGPSLAERERVTFKASLPAAMNVTWSVRIGDTGAISTRRGRCLLLSDDCTSVVPDGSPLTFNYHPVVPSLSDLSTLEAYDEPIIITAATVTGFSELTTTLTVPALPSLALEQSQTVPCLPLGNTLRRVDVPDAWFAFELLSSESISDVSFQVLDPAINSAWSWPKQSYTKNRAQLTHPMRGHGAPALASFQCASGVEGMTVNAKAEQSSGTIPVGKLTTLTPNDVGKFYLVGSLPPNPEVVKGGSVLGAVSRVEEDFSGDVALFASDGTRGRVDKTGSFATATSIPLDPDREYALSLIRSGRDLSQVIIDAPAPRATLALGQTAGTKLAMGFLPGRVDVTAPVGWLLLSNDQGADFDTIEGEWRTFARPALERDWGVVFSQGGTHAFQLTRSLTFFFPDGLDINVSATPTKGVVAAGVTTNGAFSGALDDFAHLYEFDGSVGDKVTLTATASQSTTVLVVDPSRGVVAECSPVLCGNSPITIQESGRHAIAVSRDDRSSGPQTYAFSFTIQ
jgi:PKD repeat protein